MAWFNVKYTRGSHVFFNTVVNPNVMFTGEWVKVSETAEDVIQAAKELQSTAFEGVPNKDKYYSLVKQVQESRL